MKRILKVLLILSLCVGAMGMREYHEIRKDMSGDAEAAAPYIGQARVLLGALKTQMQLGGLSQLSRTHYLPDGTVIRVASVFGQDVVRITAGQSTPAIPEEALPADVFTREAVHIPGLDFSVDVRRLVVAGNYLGADGNYAPFIWSQRTGFVAIPMPSDAGGIATALSADGKTVVGYVRWTSGMQRAFRWAAAAGTQLIAGEYTQASSVSANGRVITGILLGGYDPGVFRWTEKTGIAGLSGSQSIGTPSVSGNGRYIAAQRAAGYVAVWKDDGSRYNQPNGWYGAGIFGGGGGLGVTDDGRSPIADATLAWRLQGAIGSGAIMAPAEGRAFYNPAIPALGSYPLSYYWVLALTPKGDKIVGKKEVRVPGIGGPTVTARLPVVWTAATGIAYLPAGGSSNGSAAAISADGAYAAGNITLSDRSVAVWALNSSGATLVDIPALSAAKIQSGYAVGIAHPETTIESSIDALDIPGAP